MNFKSLFFCLFETHDFVTDRNEQHELIFRCQSCGVQRVILSPSSEVTHGPQSVQEEVLGTPKIKAIRVASMPEKSDKLAESTALTVVAFTNSRR